MLKKLYCFLFVYFHPHLSFIIKPRKISFVASTERFCVLICGSELTCLLSHTLCHFPELQLLLFSTNPLLFLFLFSPSPQHSHNPWHTSFLLILSCFLFPSHLLICSLSTFIPNCFTSLHFHTYPSLSHSSFYFIFSHITSGPIQVPIHLFVM